MFETNPGYQGDSDGEIEQALVRDREDDEGRSEC